jgi:hypothetical protein
VRFAPVLLTRHANDSPGHKTTNSRNQQAKISDRRMGTTIDLPEKGEGHAENLG